MDGEARGIHFGVLSFTGAGHLSPLIALGQELARRGHRVTFFEREKVRDHVCRAGLGFVCLEAHRTGRLKTPTGESGLLSELALLRFNLQRIQQDLESYLQATPDALRKAGVEALIVNEVALTGPTVAELLGIPYFLVSTSIPHAWGWNGFPWFAGYRSRTSFVSRMERAVLEVSALRVRGPLRWCLQRFRRDAGLGPLRLLATRRPPHGFVTQWPECLTGRISRRERGVLCAGPFLNRDARPPVEFPWERLDGRPLIYLTLGTTRNVQALVIRIVAEACHDLPVQLIVTLGKRFRAEEFADLAGSAIVVEFAPQLELLKRAAVVISHGGCNTSLEALSEGKPMVLIPLAYDQPAVAARLMRAGVAEVLPVKRLSVNGVRSAIATVLHVPAYRKAAIALQAALCATRGVGRAARMIEEKLGVEVTQMTA